MAGSHETSRNWRAQPPSRRGQTREWRYRESTQRSRLSKRTQIGLWGCGLLGITALIVYFLVLLGGVRPARLIAFGVGPYPALPPNPFAREDTQRFAQLARSLPHQFPQQPELLDDQLTKAELLPRLTEMQESVAGQNLIVFCSLHGRARPGQDGAELYTIHADSDADAQDLLPIRDLLRSLRGSAASHVLLLLDANRFRPNWRLGLLSHEFSEQLRRDVEQELRLADEDRSEAQTSARLTIFCAAGPNERSWTSPEWRQSTFAHFCVEGLQGQADGWGEKGARSHAPDHRVDLHELFHYVEQKVDEWANRNRDASQTVLWLGDQSNVDLVALSDRTKPRPKTSKGQDKQDKGDPKKAGSTQVAAKDASGGKTAKAADKQPPKTEKPYDPVEHLTKLWDRRDAFRASHLAAAEAPRHWRALQAHLIRAEEQLRFRLPEQARQTLKQAEVILKELTSLVGPSGVLGSHQGLAADLDLFGDRSKTLTPQAEAAVAQFAQSQLTGAPAQPASGESASEAKTAPAPAARPTPPPPEQVVAWILKRLQRREETDSLVDLARLLPPKREIWPTELVFLSEFAARYPQPDRETTELARRALALHRQFRLSLAEHPAALSFVRDHLHAGLRELDAGERWLLAPGENHFEARRWLDQADQSLMRISRAAEQVTEAIRLHRELLAELPDAAYYVAQRAEDQAGRKINWQGIRLASIPFRQSDTDRTGSLDVGRHWPATPIEQSSLEQQLLRVMLGTRELGALLEMTATTSGVDLDTLNRLREQVDADWMSFRSLLDDRLDGMSPSQPNVATWREADRLLLLPWIERGRRNRLATIVQKQPRGGVLVKRDRSPAEAGLWHAFWAMQCLTLAGCDADRLEQLWETWDECLETLDSSEKADQERGRQLRLQLGRDISEGWRELADSLESSLPVESVVRLAAGLDGLEPLAFDPDSLVTAHRRDLLVQCLHELAADASRRALRHPPYASVAHRTEELIGALGGTPAKWERSAPRIVELPAVQLNVQGRGELPVQVSDHAGERLRLVIRPDSPLVRLSADGSEWRESDSLELPANRPEVSVLLSSEADAPQTLTVALVDAEGFPWDIRQTRIHPQFDPSRWRIEFRAADSGRPVYTEKLLPRGMKLFLPPQGKVRLKAVLIRPEDDTTPAADVAVFRKSELGELLLTELKDVALTPGQSETPLVFGSGAAEPKPESSAPATPPAPSALDISDGLIVRMTPKGQPPFDFEIQPVFWNAEEFVQRPVPSFIDDQVLVSIRRQPIPQDGFDRLLPLVVPVELEVPPDVRRSSQKSLQIPALKVGEPGNAAQDLWVKLTPAIRDAYEYQPLEISLSVAGLPHAFRWELSRNRTKPLPSAGESMVRIAQPFDGQMVLASKEPLPVELQVDGPIKPDEPWRLTYEVRGENAARFVGESWRLEDRIRRHIDLVGLQGGVWQIATAAEDFKHAIPTEGRFGRFHLIARLWKGESVQAEDEALFVIDDERPPAVRIEGLSKQPHLMTRPLRFGITASDPESGLSQVDYGFDHDNDHKLSETERLGGFPLNAIENREWSSRPPIEIPSSQLAQRNEGPVTLLVVAKNGLGKEGAAHVIVPLEKPPTPKAPEPPKPPTTGWVRLTINVSGKKKIELSSGHQAETTGVQYTSPALPAGKYTVTVKGYNWQETKEVTVIAGEVVTVPVK